MGMERGAEWGGEAGGRGRKSQRLILILQHQSDLWGNPRSSLTPADYRNRCSQWWGQSCRSKIVRMKSCPQASVGEVRKKNDPGVNKTC